MSDMELRFRVTASMAEAKAVLDQGAAAFREFGAQANNSMRTASAGQQVFRNSAAMTGNVAAQFNDIGVMLAAGQNPFQLAIQQGTQLSQALVQMGGGVRGAVAALRSGFMSLLSPTTLLTMAVIAGGAALVQWAFDTGKAVDAAKNLDEAIASLKEVTENYAEGSLDKLQKKYGEVDAALVQLLNSQRDNAMGEAQRKANEAVEGLIAAIPGVETAEGRGFVSLMKRMGMTANEVNELRDAITQLRGAMTFDDKAAALVRLDGILSKSAISGTEAATAITNAGLAMREIGTLAETASGQIGGAAVSAEDLWRHISAGLDMMVRLADAGPAADWLSSAISQASTLWDWLRKAAEEREALLRAMRSPFTAPDANGRIVDRSQWNSGNMGRGLPTNYEDQLAAVFNPVVAEVEDAGTGVSRALDKMAKDAKTPLEALAEQMSRSLTDPLADFIKGSATAQDVGTRFLDAIKNKLIEVAMQQAQTQLFTPLLGQIFGGLSGGGLGGSILSAFGIPGHARGGLVDGVGSGTSDSNLRRLSKGEFVVKASATARNLGLLQSINAGDVMSRAAAPLMPSAGAAAPRAAAGGVGGQQPVVVNVLPPPGHTANVAQRMQGGQMVLDVVIEQIEGRMAENLRRGRGPQAAVLESAYGLTRRPR